MKIFSKHRKKLEPSRRYGSREFKEKLTVAKNYKRAFGPQKGFVTAFFAKTGLSQIGTYVAVLVVGVIFYFLVISPYFLITQVAVAGNKQVPTTTIKEEVSKLSEKRFLLVPQNSFFVLNQNRLGNLFTKNVPMVSEVKATRHWPNKITIEVKERNPALVLVVGSKNYLIDDSGFVIGEVQQNAPQLKIVDSVEEEIKISSSIDGKIIPFIISMEKQWPAKMNISIKNVKIPGKAASEVEFVSAEGWSVFFSTDRPVTNQLNNLTLLLNKQVTGANRARLAYIDLRLAKWAYYCFKSTPCQQTDQDSLAAGAKKPEAAAASSNIQTPVVQTQP
jgi:cell division septal protein FtsQ